MLAEKVFLCWLGINVIQKKRVFTLAFLAPLYLITNVNFKILYTKKQER